MPKSKELRGEGGTGVRRLYRSRDERMIGGVCGGVAEYFAIDVTVVRVLWVVAIFAQGLGIIAYLAALLLIPDNPDHAAVPVKKSRLSDNSLIVVGALIIALGLMFLFRIHRIGYPFVWSTYYYRFFRWDLVWPVIIILIGALWIYYVLKRENVAAGREGGAPEKVQSRRLLRSNSDRKIAGVCGGLSNYLHVDSSFIRVGWVLLTIYTQVIIGVLAYIAMVIAVPQEE